MWWVADASRRENSILLAIAAAVLRLLWLLWRRATHSTAPACTVGMAAGSGTLAICLRLLRSVVVLLLLLLLCLLRSVVVVQLLLLLVVEVLVLLELLVVVVVLLRLVLW